ncbi:GNAT family N-acetyltransferase [Conyzicola sp.]|uniref:GNAT family N-acetyltransferase n=1 Tax=Conyzicola sp. TaxID=1969404 RepID=UPI00398977CE
MTAARPPRTPLVGDFIRLDPLLKTDVPDLFTAIAHPLVFAGGFGGGPAGYTDDLADFTAFADSYFAWERSNVHAVRLVGGENDGLLVGTSTLGDFDLDLEHAHIGWTAYDPRVWGTAVNAEAKLMLLGTAFDNGFGRVKLQADVLNERSRAAITKIGAQFEGIVRRDRRRADGTWRDSAIFSVVVDEWPEVRAGLQARLAAYGAEPVRLRAARDGG